MKKRPRLTWEEVLERYVIPYKEERGDLLVPYAYKTADGYALGKWVAQQRHRRAALTGRQIADLDRIGMVWKIRHQEHVPLAEVLSYLDAYQEEHHDLAVPQTYTAPDGFPLGKWVARARTRYKCGELSTAAMAELDRRDMVWVVTQPSLAQLMEETEKAFHNLGTINVSGAYTTPDGYPLGKKLASIRYGRSRGSVSRETQEFFDGYGIDWQPGPSHRDRVCAVPDCRHPHSTNGMCSFHANRWRRTGSPVLCEPDQTCPVHGCDQPVAARGWCAEHLHAVDDGHGRSAYRNRHLSCGGRCEVCRADHIRERAEGRLREIDRDILPFKARRDLVAALWSGEHLGAVCAQAGVSPGRLWTLARSVPGFTEALDAALTATRRSDVEHGKEHTYRKYRCRCPECRAAKRPTP